VDGKPVLPSCEKHHRARLAETCPEMPAAACSRALLLRTSHYNKMYYRNRISNVSHVFVRNHFLNIINGTVQSSDHRVRSTVGPGSQRRGWRCLQLRVQQLLYMGLFHLITCLINFETQLFCSVLSVCFIKDHRTNIFKSTAWSPTIVRRAL